MGKHKHGAEPAIKIVALFGGCRALARLLELNPSTISRWTASTFHHGTNGRIPQKYWPRLIEAAEQRGMALTVNDLSGM